MAPIDTSALLPSSLSSSVSSPAKRAFKNKLARAKKRPARNSSRRELFSSEDEDDHFVSKLKRGRLDDMASYHQHHHIVHPPHHHPLGGVSAGSVGHHHVMHHNGVGQPSNGGGGSRLVEATTSSNATTSNSTSSSSARFSSASSSVSSSSKSTSIASLCNLGNTCFLNSVLYTLRFTPGFLHNLHHMEQDLSNLSNAKKRSGSSNTNCQSSEGEAADMVQEVIQKLHDLFKTLSCADDAGDNREPIPPQSFLNAVSKLNPIFEGNQQQDAHELLVMLLNILEDIRIPVRSTATTPDAGLPPPPFELSEKKGKKMRSSKSNGVTASSTPAYINGSLSNGAVTAASTSYRDSLRTTLPNFVKENFEGKSVMRTRCLECEMSTFRSETFTNIDVPLQLEDEDDAHELSGGRDLFLKQILMSETLRENNKYWCEECSRLNEAQRSVQYELLPKVMVLQLKRFTAAAANAKSSYMSKINDFIPTPFTLNCFCTQCIGTSGSTRQQRASGGSSPKHHYRLYAVIMHLGATLASGHYIAYVRASAQDSQWDYSLCQRGSASSGSSGSLPPAAGGTFNGDRVKHKKGSIMKFLRRKDEGKSSNSGSSEYVNGSSETYLSASSSASSSSTVSCKSAKCCGIRGSISNVSGGNNNSDLLHQFNQRSVDSCDSGSTNDCCNSEYSSSAGNNGDDDLWLECDDETIQVVTRKQFEEVLSAKQGATTPYLLFYQKF